MKKFLVWLAQTVRHRPWWIVIFVGVLTAAAAVPLPRLNTKPHLDDLMPAEGLRDRDALVRLFPGGTEPIPLLLDAGRGNVFDRDNLLELSRLDAHLRQGKSTRAMFPGPEWVLGPHRIVDFFVAQVNKAIQAGHFAARAAALRNDAVWLDMIMKLMSRIKSEEFFRDLFQAAGKWRRDNAEIDDLKELVRILAMPLGDRTLVRDYLGRIFDKKGYLRRLSAGKLRLRDLRQDQIDAVFQFIFARQPDVRQLFSADLKRDETGRLRARFALMILARRRGAIDLKSEESDVRIIDAVAAFKPSVHRIVVFGGMDAQMQKDQQQGSQLLLLSLLIICAVLYRSFRKAVDVALPMVGLVIVNIWMFGAAALLGFKFSVLTLMAPILCVSLGVDYAIQSITRYRAEVAGGHPVAEAVQISVANVGGALLMATVTTVVGFLASLLSPIPAIAHFGGTVAVGIAASFVVQGVFVPTIRYLIDRRRERLGKPLRYRGTADEEKRETLRREEWGEEGSSPRLGRALAYLVDHPRLVTAAAVLLTLGSIVLAVGLGTAFDWRDNLSDEAVLTRAADTMAKNFPHSFVDEVDLLVRGDLGRVEALRALERVVRNTADDSHTARSANGEPKVLSILPAVRLAVADKKQRRRLQLRDADRNGLPDTDAGTRRLLLDLVAQAKQKRRAPVMGLTPPADITAILSPDLRATRIRVNVTGAAGNTIAMAEIYHALQSDLAPLRRAGLKGTLSGQVVLIHLMSDTIVTDVVTSTGITLLVCLIILIIALRSFILGLLNMVPVVLVIVWLLGIMRIFGFDLNVLTVLITTLCVGVGIDFAIHITHRYVEERTAGYDPRESVLRAATHLGGAMLDSTLTTALGFGVLVFASQAGLRIFATLAFFMITFSYMLAMVLMPVLLNWVDRGKRMERASRQIAAIEELREVFTKPLPKTA